MFSLEDSALVYCTQCRAAFEKAQLNHRGPFHVLSNGVASIPCPRCSYTVETIGRAYHALYWPQQTMSLRKTQKREEALENLARLWENEAHLFGGLNGYHIRFFDLSSAEKIDWGHVSAVVAENPLALRFVTDVLPEEMSWVCEKALLLGSSSATPNCKPHVMRFIPENNPHYDRLVCNVFCGKSELTPFAIQYIPKVTVNIARVLLTWSITKSREVESNARLTEVSHLKETTRQIAKRWGMLSPSEKHDVVEFLAYKLWEESKEGMRDSLSFWLEAEEALSC